MFLHLQIKLFLKLKRVGNPFNETEGYNAEVQASTKRLLEIVIPNVALKINSHEITLFDNEGLVVVMHKYGINLRFLGLLVFQNLKNKIQN